MKKDKYIQEFLFMRASGETYKKITEETGVSKQTLIKWNKQHADEIKEMKKQLAEKYIKYIIYEKDTDIRHLFNVYYDISTNNRTDEERKNKAYSRVKNKLNKIFGIKIKRINISFFDIEKITHNSVEIECE